MTSDNESSADALLTEVCIQLQENHDGQQKHDLPLVRRHRTEAAEFYAETLPDSTVDAMHHAPGGYPSNKQGDINARSNPRCAADPCLSGTGKEVVGVSNIRHTLTPAMLLDVDHCRFSVQPRP